MWSRKSSTDPCYRLLSEGGCISVASGVLCAPAHEKVSMQLITGVKLIYSTNFSLIRCSLWVDRWNKYSNITDNVTAVLICSAKGCLKDYQGHNSEFALFMCTQWMSVSKHVYVVVYVVDMSLFYCWKFMLCKLYVQETFFFCHFFVCSCFLSCPVWKKCKKMF